MTVELVDFSLTADADWVAMASAIKTAGKHGKFRYLVDDDSPTGRGYTRAEHDADLAAGLELGFYWEGTASWMLGGYAAGVQAAQNFEKNRLLAGVAPVPAHFAHDVDPDPATFSTLDACLRGAATVLGWDRIGGYGGWSWIDYLASGGTVKYLVQAQAWEYGRGIHPAATMYQHDHITIDGTECDLLTAFADNYGQESRFLAPTYEKPHPIRGTAPQQIDGNWAYPFNADCVAMAHIDSHVTTSDTSPKTGPGANPGQTIHCGWITCDNTHEIWVVGTGGSRMRFHNMKVARVRS